MKCQTTTPTPDTNELANMRTLLAAERTFLAWVRTALGLMAFGFVLEKFVWYLHETGLTQRAFTEVKVLSFFAFASGGCIFFAAARRFFLITCRLGKGNNWFHAWPEVLLVVILALVLTISMVASVHILG
ncbi:MAG: YidH family protein [Desulfovibrio sp.]|uniref:YidH family protein n=1 Tax=Desulfovibrio sp. 7SRBS1 TaxID=3378064 RepID=UPI003B42493C